VEPKLTEKERLGLLRGGGFLTVNYFVGITEAIPRLGVPALKMQDSSNGFRPTAPGEYGSSTSWPSSLCLASGWDEGFVETVARAMAREFKGKGANVLLGPGVNVHRTPYGGRNFEYLSGEDPHLGARLASSFVKAVQSEGVMAVVKHFAFNEQETARGSENSIVGERTAWELYYPPFEAAVNAGVGAAMCAYNKVNGSYSCGNPELLNGHLKQSMGFPGFVMSDWGASHSPLAIEGGLDMEMPKPKHFKKKKLANVSMAAVNEAVRRILASVYHLRLDEHPGCELPCIAERKSNQRTGAHVELAREGATRGVILLKNDGLLPLSSSSVRTLAILGMAADAKDTMNTWGPGSYYSGGGSGHVASPHVVTPQRGIQERAERAGIRVLLAAELPPANGTPAVPNVSGADAVIIVAATTATESKDRVSLALDAGADELIAAVARERPTIVLLEAPGAVLTPWRSEAAAVACLFLGGEQTGRGWAAVLFGDAEPSGRLPIMLPAADSPRPEAGDVRYSEGLFTSYRALAPQAAFPFGHGLSYTRFDWAKPRQPADCSAAACLRVVITNVGARAGSEVVQAYLQFNPRLKGPRLSLRGFRRTRLLQPGEHEEVELAFTARDMSTYVRSLGWQQQAWAVVHLGASSGDIRHLMPLRGVAAISVLS